MTTWGRILLGTAVVALGTWFLGWLAPVAWGVVAGVVWPGSRPVSIAVDAGSAAALGWLLLLVLPMLQGAPVAVLAPRLAGAMQIPTVALVATTLFFPALLAGCAAWVAAAPRRSIGDSAASRPGLS